MQMLTHGHTNPPVGPAKPLADLAAHACSVDQALVTVADPQAADLGGCDYCDPTNIIYLGVTTVTWVNPLNNPVERVACALCISTALNEATSDGREVTIRAALRPIQ
jgi:hypothetical protein